jgi:hypothetical protein
LGVRGERASELSRGYEVMEAATGPSRRRARQESPDSLSPCSFGSPVDLGVNVASEGRRVRGLCG